MKNVECTKGAHKTLKAASWAFHSSEARWYSVELQVAVPLVQRNSRELSIHSPANLLALGTYSTMRNSVFRLVSIMVLLDTSSSPSLFVLRSTMW